VNEGVEEPEALLLLTLLMNYSDPSGPGLEKNTDGILRQKSDSKSLRLFSSPTF
jgi:hypothetical protein